MSPASRWATWRRVGDGGRNLDWHDRPVLSTRTADGRDLGYRRMGTGPVLVCHPGGPGFSSLYFGDLAGLWERFTLVLLDPRGTGGSGPAAGPRARPLPGPFPGPGEG